MGGALIQQDLCPYRERHQSNCLSFPPSLSLLASLMSTEMRSDEHSARWWLPVNQEELSTETNSVGILILGSQPPEL